MIGRRHIRHVLNEDCSELLAIVDPTQAARDLAAEENTVWHYDLRSLLQDHKPDGLIVATPNQMHVANGLEAVAAGIPVLIEKPIADQVSEATTLVEAADHAGVPLLAGHHRRHNPLIQAAKKAIEEGRIGQIVAVHATCWFHKPDSYFGPQWRREKGAGPVLTNLIHDIDLLRYLCGDVVSVQAMDSNQFRGNTVEETAVILLRFASGALGTVTVSDKIVSPWSWEFTSGENTDYTHTEETCYMIGGTHGSLTVPYLDLWHHRNKPDWLDPLDRHRLPVEAQDPLALQVRNLCDVIRGTAKPVVPGREGLNTLKVIAAVKQAAETGTLIHVQ